MGHLRFILASAVVFFHLGGWGMLTGRLAVMGFYVVSGYLITRVLDIKYNGFKGKLAFIINRILRLYPLFIILSILSYMCYNYLGSVPVVAGNSNELWLPAKPTIEGLSLMPELKWDQNGFPLLLGGGNIIPQSWSIGIELSFYVAAVIGAFINLRISLYVIFILSSLYFAAYFLRMEDFKDGYDNGIYKDALSSAWMFALGGIIYLQKFDGASKIKFYTTLIIATFIILGILSNAVFGSILEKNLGGWKIILALSIILTAFCVGLVLANMPESESKISRMLGDLSYGMYLNHFLVAYSLMYLNAVFGFSIFGRINTPGFGISALYISVAFSYMTHSIVERPIDSFRKKLQITFAESVRFS